MITLKLSLFLRIVLSFDVYEKDDDQHVLIPHPWFPTRRLGVSGTAKSFSVNSLSHILTYSFKAGTSQKESSLLFASHVEVLENWKVVII